MAKYRFERQPGGVDVRANVINFDSAPKGSICRQYGYHEPTMELRESGRKADVEIYYDVYAANREGARVNKIGVLRETNDVEIRRKYG